MFKYEWMKENFGAEPKQSLNSEYYKYNFGCPDVGSGRYIMERDYKDWVTFNNAQRVHQNYFERI